MENANLWPNEAALLAFYLKFYFTSSSNDLAPGVLLFTPCKEMKQILLLRSRASAQLSSHPEEWQEGRGRERGQMGREKSEEISHIWPGTQTASIKSAGETRSFLMRH